MLHQIHHVLPLVKEETGVDIRFLTAIRRIPLTLVKENITSNNYLTEAIQALKVVCKDPYVVGSDFVGEEINDIAELKEHPLSEAGFNSVVCDALRVIGIITLAELVNCSNMQQLITVIDALPVDDKKAFYSACRRANIKISEEIRSGTAESIELIRNNALVFTFDNIFHHCLKLLSFSSASS